MEELNRKKVEKDLCELQQLINRHFEERKKEEVELEDLRDRIEKRKKMRAEQIIVRQQREKERRERERVRNLPNPSQFTELLERPDLERLSTWNDLQCQVHRKSIQSTVSFQIRSFQVLVFYFTLE